MVSSATRNRIIIAVVLAIGFFVAYQVATNLTAHNFSRDTTSDKRVANVQLKSTTKPTRRDQPWMESYVFPNRKEICNRLMKPPTEAIGTAKESPPPPKWGELTSNQHDAYLMWGRAFKFDYYLDDRVSSTQNAGDKYRPYKRSEIDAFMTRVRNKDMNYYHYTDLYLYDALEKYPIKDKNVLILGSLVPWYESVCLAYGAKTCTTVEYNKLEYDHPNIKTYTVHEFLSMKERPEYDAAFSISSYEHDGLGRYGDPLNPFGDLQTMLKAKCFIKEGGLLYLAIPVGPDKLRWNADRVYGRTRLSLLMRPFTTISSFGMDANILDVDVVQYTQPVFVAINGPFVNEDIYLEE